MKHCIRKLGAGRDRPAFEMYNLSKGENFKTVEITHTLKSAPFHKCVAREDGPESGR